MPLGITDSIYYDAIAEAIKAKIGSSENLTPEEITAKATELINNAVNSVKLWEVEIVSRSNKGSTIMTDQWLATHRNDENLLLAIIPYDYSADTTSTIPGAVVMNFNNIGGKKAQLAFYRTSSGIVEGRSSNAIQDTPVANASSYYYVNERGDVIYNATNYLQPSGTLKIAAWLV